MLWEASLIELFYKEPKQNTHLLRYLSSILICLHLIKLYFSTLLLFKINID